jgi:hypothetical protein
MFSCGKVYCFKIIIIITFLKIFIYTVGLKISSLPILIFKCNNMLMRCLGIILIHALVPHRIFPLFHHIYHHLVHAHAEQ